MTPKPLSVEDVARTFDTLHRHYRADKLESLRAHIAALEADIAAKDDAFRLYVEERGVEHDDAPASESACPEDGTCECPRILALNAAFGPDHPGAHLLAEHAKAMAELEALREYAATAHGPEAWEALKVAHAKALVRARNDTWVRAARSLDNLGFANLASVFRANVEPES